MFQVKGLLSPLNSKCARSLVRHYHVTVVGGATDVGQSLSLLLRSQPAITTLHVHDIQEQIPGITQDLSHIPTETTIKGFYGNDTLEKALENSNIVIAVGGLTRKPGVSKSKLIATNTDFIRNVMTKVAKLDPLPFVAIVTEPINCLVPMAAEVMRNHGDHDPRKLFGVATVDSLRAQALYAAHNNINPSECDVPVIGGRSEKTLIPLLSQTKPRAYMDEQNVRELITKIRNCDEDVTRSKCGWAPTLSVAYGALVFTQSILDALNGHAVKVNAFVENNDFGTSYFSGLVNVNQHGAGEMDRFIDMTQYECHLLERTIIQLRKDIKKGKKILELA